MMNLLRKFLHRLPPYQELLRQRDALQAELNRIQPGHYYSPIPSHDFINDNRDELFDRSLRDLPGIDIREEQQLQLLEKLAQFYADVPFDENENSDRRYYWNNDVFNHSDAIFLFCLMRHLKPKRIIEIGSGFSSFVMMDTNELFFDNQIELTFIEPYDERLRSRMKPEDLERTTILQKGAQDVDLSLFEQLEENDILFIDSTHVSKIGSDVNMNMFSIVPRVKPGVVVHIHDMFYPFEYPEAWVQGGRYWNEAYMVRAFLQYNAAFEVLIWNQFLGTHHPQKLESLMPNCMHDIGGSLWLRRVN